MKAYLTRRYHIAASHRLHTPALDEAANRATYGKCNNPHGHGHNYAVEITVGGEVNRVTGMVCDMVELDEYVHQYIVERFDHQNLNLLPEFAECVPTTENLAVAVYEIARGFRDAEVEQVRIEETSSNSFVYSGGKPPRE